MPSSSKTKRKMPSPQHAIRRTFDSPVRVVRRSSPLWKKHTQKTKAVRWWSPQPQPPLMSTAELVQKQHEKWKEDQEKLRRAANITRRHKIQKNIELGRYLPPESMATHNVFSDQKVSNFWRNAQHTIDTDLDWASKNPPLHFGGRQNGKRRK